MVLPPLAAALSREVSSEWLVLQIGRGQRDGARLRTGGRWGRIHQHMCFFALDLLYGLDMRGSWEELYVVIPTLGYIM